MRKVKGGGSGPAHQLVPSLLWHKAQGEGGPGPFLKGTPPQGGEGGGVSLLTLPAGCNNNKHAEYLFPTDRFSGGLISREEKKPRPPPFSAKRMSQTDEDENVT